MAAPILAIKTRLHVCLQRSLGLGSGILENFLLTDTRATAIASFCCGNKTRHVSIYLASQDSNIYIYIQLFIYLFIIFICLFIYKTKESYGAKHGLRCPLPKEDPENMLFIHDLPTPSSHLEMTVKQCRHIHSFPCSSMYQGWEISHREFLDVIQAADATYRNSDAALKLSLDPNNM